MGTLHEQSKLQSDLKNSNQKRNWILQNSNSITKSKSDCNSPRWNWCPHWSWAQDLSPLSATTSRQIEHETEPPHDLPPPPPPPPPQLPSPSSTTTSSSFPKPIPNLQNQKLKTLKRFYGPKSGSTEKSRYTHQPPDEDDFAAPRNFGITRLNFAFVGAKRRRRRCVRDGVFSCEIFWEKFIFKKKKL